MADTIMLEVRNIKRDYGISNNDPAPYCTNLGERLGNSGELEKNRSAIHI